MSNYCTVRDIETLLGFPEETFTTASRPTKVQVEREIDQVTNEIDFALATIGINTQPTDARFLAVLRNQCSYGVACRVGVSAMGNNTSVTDSQPSFYCQRFEAFLTDIQDNPEKYGVVSNIETFDISNNITDGTMTESQYNDRFLDEPYEV